MKQIILLVFLLLTSCLSTPTEQGNIEVRFCPYDNCEDLFIDTIQDSKEVRCAFYDIDLENLKDALKNSQVLVFKDNYDYFGISVDSPGLMHNKFCILDKKSIITGSFNPTINGNFKNNNNIIYIESKTLANNYLEEFKELQTRTEKKTKNKK